MSKADLSEAARLLAQQGASKGGKTAAARMTTQQRQARAAQASAARWATYREGHPEPYRRPAYVSGTERRLTQQLEELGRVVVTSRRELRAAEKLVARGGATLTRDVNGFLVLAKILVVS